MVDAPRTESSLRDLEASALTEQHIVGWNPDILENNLGVAVRLASDDWRD